MNSHSFFTKPPPLKLFFLASLPGAAGMLASALYQLLDGIFVGQFLGETPFAALNLAMPFVIINFALADLIGVGSSVPISISLGKKEEQEANNLFTCSCLMIVLSGIFVSVLLYAAAPALIGFMGAKGDFARFATEYLRVYAICSPVTTIVFAADNYLRICGRIRYSMFVNIFMSVISAVLELIFLSVFRQVWAAALATCTGMAFCVLLSFLPFFRGKMQLRFCRPHFSARMVRQIISCGTPNFLSNIAGRITSILMNLLLVRFGGEAAVSVYGILMYVDGFIQPLLYGMCDSLQPAVGYNWGAGRFSRVRALEKCCFAASLVISVVSAIVIFLFPSQITLLFMAGADAAFLTMCTGALQLFALTYATRWLSFAAQSYLLAVGKALPASIISLSIALLFPVLFVIAFWQLGLTGLWLNFAGSSLMAGLLALFLLWKNRADLHRADSAS